MAQTKTTPMLWRPKQPKVQMSVFKLVDTIEVSESTLAEFEKQQFELGNEVVLRFQAKRGSRGIWLLLGEPDHLFI